MNVNSLTTNNWLGKATKKLENVGISTARLDCLVLLEDATGKDRSYLLAHPEEELDINIVSRLNKQIERRAGHEPLAYIRGKSEFYGREFVVNEHTLQPRPETETMIDLLKTTVLPHIQVRPVYIVDVGTGSGCIGITAKLEVPEAEVFATDISEECIETARKNAAKLNANVTFYHANLLNSSEEPAAWIPDQVQNDGTLLILANLPYVPDSHTINQAAMQEPKLAIFGGADGLDYYRELFAQIKKLKIKPAYVLTESLPFQHHGLATIARHYGYTLEKTDDFIQVYL